MVRALGKRLVCICLIGRAGEQTQPENEGCFGAKPTREGVIREDKISLSVPALQTVKLKLKRSIKPCVPSRTPLQGVRSVQIR